MVMMPGPSEKAGSAFNCRVISPAAPQTLNGHILTEMFIFFMLFLFCSVLSSLYELSTLIDG